MYASKKAFIRQRLEAEKPPTPGNSVRTQIGGELFNHRLAPALGLLPLHDQPADIPVQADQFPVDRFEGFILGGADGFPIRVNASGLREMAVRLKKMAPIFLAACGHFIA